MSEKHKKFCRVFNSTNHSLIVISTITGCVSISDFASLVGILIEIATSAIELKNRVIKAGIKMCKSIIINKKGISLKK